MSLNYIINKDYYNLIFSKLYIDNYKYKTFFNFFESNDLRSGGHLVIDSEHFLFTDSQGKIFFVELNDINNIQAIKFEQIVINNENKRLNSPYNKINLGLLSYNLKSNEYIDFKILFSGLDENAFDFTVLDKINTAIIFSSKFIILSNKKKFA